MSILNGSVKVGDNSFIGSGTIVSHDVNIKAKSFIKFGSKFFNEKISNSFDFFI